MIPLRFAFVFLLGLASTLAAQEPPHLSMRLNVTIGSGRLASRACLSRLPATHRYEFILHRGLNIKSVRNSAGTLLRYTGDVEGRFVGEGVRYTVIDSVAPTDSLCIEYVGAFPVYAVDRGDFSIGDNKGRIAFNGRTVRASEQSKWYPILYDSTRGTRANQAVTYRASVVCSDCRDIYLNGDQPKAGPEADFRSDRPVLMLLFAGDFHTERLRNLTVINATRYELSPRTLELLAGVVDSIRVYYESWLDVPYGAPLVFIQHTITENNPGRHWGFVTYPTIAFSNKGFAAFVDDSTGVVVPLVWPYLGHEMAHYYFGGVVTGRGPYSWFLVESLAEYLGLRVVRHFQGESAFQARIATYAEHALADTASLPFHLITSADQIHERYRYEYAPLLLVALEEAAGDEAMRRLVRSILRQPDRPWDYPTLREAALAAGVSLATWQDFEARCVHPPIASGCLSKYVRPE